METSTQLANCLKDNPWGSSVKMVYSYIKWLSEVDLDNPEPNITLFINNCAIKIKTLDDLPEDLQKLIFEDLNNDWENLQSRRSDFNISSLRIDKCPASYDLLLKCNDENKVQALALLYISYYTTLSHKFLNIFHYVFNMGIHTAPVDLCHINLVNFQLQILCVLCEEGRLDDIKLFVDYCHMSESRLVELLGVEIPYTFTSDFGNLIAQTYRIRKNGIKSYPLVHAITKKQFHVVEFLLKRNDSPYNVDNHGKTSLHYAFAMDDVNTILLLLNYMANEFGDENPHERCINIVDREGKTVLDYWLSNPICKNFNKQGGNVIIKNLVNFGADTAADLEIMNETGQFLFEELFSEDEYMI